MTDEETVKKLREKLSEYGETSDSNKPNSFWLLLNRDVFKDYDRVFAMLAERHHLYKGSSSLDTKHAGTRFTIYGSTYLTL